MGPCHFLPACLKQTNFPEIVYVTEYFWDAEI